MAEQESNRHPAPIGETFEVERGTDGGYIALPISMQAIDDTKIKNIFPGEWTFISNGSAQIDQQSQRISIDTNDRRLALPRRLEDLYTRPAVMRVLRGIGERATQMLDGYVMDFRWVRSLIYDDRGLAEGVGSAEFMRRQQDYEAVLPLGVVFNDDGKSLYVGAPEVRGEALQLAGYVDVIARSLGAWSEDPAQVNQDQTVNDRSRKTE